MVPLDAPTVGSTLMVDNIIQADQAMYITAYPNRDSTDTNFEFEFWVEGEAHGFFNKVYFKSENGSGFFVVSLMFLMTVIGLITGLCIFFMCKDKFLEKCARICAKCPCKKKGSGHVELAQVLPTDINITEVQDVSKIEDKEGTA